MDNTPARPMNATGYLIVEATAAEGALPISGAVVSVVSSPGTGNVSLTAETDLSGRTERLSLPTVAEGLSVVPGNANPFSIYDVTVVAPGYYPFTALHVPIFNRVTTLQPAALIALSSHDSESTFPKGNTEVENTEPFSQMP